MDKENYKKEIEGNKNIIEKYFSKLSDIQSQLSELKELDKEEKKIIGIKIERDIWNLKIMEKNLDIQRLDKLLKFNNMGYNKGDFIYIEYMKRGGSRKEMVFSNIGFVVKETLYHIKIIVYDRKRNSAHKYNIHKKYIRGIKHYDGSDLSIISYDDLLELWKKNNKKESNDVKKYGMEIENEGE